MSRRLFGTNGIRGIANKDLTPQFVAIVAQAIGTFFEGGKILVGRDGRVSSPAIEAAVRSGLLSTGCAVFKTGLVPTPALQFCVRDRGMDGGVMITASHNPPQFNGIKVIGPKGIEIPREQERKIEEIFSRGIELVEWSKMGYEERAPNIIFGYVKGILKQLNVGMIQKRNFKIVIDPGNGVGVLLADQLMKELGCQFNLINSKIDGMFPSRSPEPKPDVLSSLCYAVKKTGADLGVAYDGDADRAIFVDEKGRAHWGDRTFALIADWFLEHNPGQEIITPVSSSQAILDIALERKGKVVWTRVGSVDVSWTMVQREAKLGGEENGGVIYGPHQYVRDGGMTTALILQILAERDSSLSEELEKLPKYTSLKDKVPCKEELKRGVLEKIKESIDAPNVETIDGVKAWFEDNSWILIRPSGTEPVIRIFVEARGLRRAKELLNEYKELLVKVVRRETI